MEITIDYTWYIGCAFLGFIFQSLLKLSSLQKDANAAKIDFNWRKDYINRDYFSILLSAISPIIWLTIYDEWIAKYNFMEEFVKTSFVVFGAVGSYIIQYYLGSAKQKIC